MKKPLNPALHRRLQRLFGAVKLSMEGEAHKHQPISDRDTNEKKLAIVQDGEYYRVNCPYCHDTRYRLYVNHMFGKEDGWGRRMNFMAYCFNEGCLYKEENREDFIEKLEDVTGFLCDARIYAGKEVPERMRTVLMPGVCVPINSLKPDHKAVKYLRSRAFDPDVLYKKYKVQFCVDSHYFLASNRIIIPIFDGDDLRGWQARVVGELPWKDPLKKNELPPKYFSCPNSQFRSHCLYNFDSMKRWATGVVVEGPTDVWRFGAMSGCIFGNCMTDHQRRKVLAVFRRRSLVLLLDPDQFEGRAKTRTRDLIEWFREKMPGKFAAVQLPDGNDPGSMTRDFLREYVRAEAAEQGVTVTYKKWSKSA